MQIAYTLSNQCPLLQSDLKSIRAAGAMSNEEVAIGHRRGAGRESGLASWVSLET